MSSSLFPRTIECEQVQPTSSKRVTAQHTLERVRNNQRRHRAQRREYIATLEQKLGHAEQRITTLREQVDTLRAELVQYRKQDASTSLLDTPPATQPSPRSLDSQAVSPLADAMEGGTVTPFGLPLFQFLVPDSLLGPELAGPDSPHGGWDNNIDDAGSHAAADALRPLVRLNQPANHITGAPIAAASWSSGGGAGCPSCPRNVPDVALQRLNHQFVGSTRSWLLAAGTLYSTPLAAESCCYGHMTENESTMLCAEAYLLIEQQNFKGVHQKDVVTWLWTGFREPPNPGEGCRVKTDLLFSLLAFISSIKMLEGGCFPSVSSISRLAL